MYANNKAYFVLDFNLTNVAENVTGLKYQGKDVTLYKKIQFSDENDIITADENHALYGFIVTDGTDKGVASVNATVTAVTE
ncbi:MAG: hypothetical protein IJ583_10830 [Firmicutes bacterium]|nr:hypothetical protein [Bacillota bacterium]